ncbi:MAG: hypothetical protein R3D05_08215 [Dongiaceae bacterium]
MKQLFVVTTATFLFSVPLALAASNDNAAPAMASNQKAAAAETTAPRCIALEAEFDKAEAAHKAAPHFKEALALETEGKTLCATDKVAAGAKYVESALKMIDAMKPTKS